MSEHRRNAISHCHHPISVVVPTKCTLVCGLESRLKLLAGAVPTVSILHPASFFYESLHDMDGVCQREIESCLRMVCVVFKKECEIVHLNHKCNISVHTAYIISSLEEHPLLAVFRRNGKSEPFLSANQDFLTLSCFL